MSRLIDADEFRATTFKNGRFVFRWHDMLNEQFVFENVYNDFAAVVNATPTAYDVDNVIEELKSKAFITGEESNNDGCYTDGRFSAVPLDVAIDIVKRGGVIHEYYFTNDTVGDAVKIVMRGGVYDRVRETEGS